jgi:CPA2 family monovalent cation:H+ antiporter-2
MDCPHLADIVVTEPTVDVCAQCVESGDVWPALRMCLVCGNVGCCDTSKNRHAQAHYEETGHPLMRSIRMDEGWMWCYEDNAFFEKRTFEKYR